VKICVARTVHLSRKPIVLKRGKRVDTRRSRRAPRQNRAMFRSGFATAPTRRAGELVSHVLLQQDDADTALAVTWVEVPPGVAQAPHRHAPEQVYVIVRGRGRMCVDDAAHEVGPGDLVLAPSGALHGIENIGDGVLEYVSAATPTFSVTDHYDNGPTSEVASCDRPPATRPPGG
jgi:mannose-6-phosphate isomerase-like protein (cupin superfamily)